MNKEEAPLKDPHICQNCFARELNDTPRLFNPSKRWINGQKIATFPSLLSKVKQMLILLKTIILLSRCDVSNTLSVS
jgi:hypothetical protein